MSGHESKISNRQSMVFFIDNCLPFGCSISCAHFQLVSDAIAHIVKVKSEGKVPVNYLDDFLFMAILSYLCNEQMNTFLEVCKRINFPLLMRKLFGQLNT